MKKLALLLTLPLVLSFGCTKEDLYALFHGHDDHKKPIVQHAEADIFMPAGEFGGEHNVLEPGTFFPPADGSHATLRRGYDYIQFNLHTTGLPPGAYTIWYVIFNDPNACSDECGEDDLFLPKTAIVWATGGMIHESGIGNFRDKLYVGERREPGSQEAMLGEGLDYPLYDPKGAEVHLIVKYHGPASDDPDVLYEQLNTVLGSCGENEGANSVDLGPPFGIQCFDPQAVIFPAPGEDMGGH